MKKHIHIYLTIALVALALTCISPGMVSVAAPTVYSNYKAAILIETNTGQVLYQYNMNKVLAQASLTKLMTYYTFMRFADESGLDLNKKITIDVKSFNIPFGGSKIGWRKGDVVSVKDLISTLLIISANDSAEALKRIYNSKGMNMIADMNRLSAELGFPNSRFVSVSGLTEKVGERKKYNVTTAYELAKLACIVLNEYPAILKTTSRTFCIVNGKKYTSTNKLLFKYRNIDGLKTGRTVEAGYCMAATSDVTEAIGHGRRTRLLAIVLGCPTDSARFSEAKKLIDYGVENFVNYKAAAKDSDIKIMNEYYKNGFIKCTVKRDAYILKNINDEVSKMIIFSNKLDADIAKGEKIGVLKIRVGKTEMQQELVASDHYSQKPAFFRALISIKNFINGLFH